MHLKLKSWYSPSLWKKYTVHCKLDSIFQSNLVQMGRQGLKLVMKDALEEDQKLGKKWHFFTLLIKLNIRASIWGALFTKKYSIAWVTSKKPCFDKKCKICLFQYPPRDPLFPIVFFSKCFFLQWAPWFFLSEARNHFFEPFYTARKSTIWLI